ncbi:MAG: transcription termination/antitermination protein NusG [Eubacteriales bacterium]|jgi:transcriptional antiterminator NusG|nr:transcription termination/antitermination protein NusG [Eubacteriales bacterium]NCC81746.1 transcription termination/antitermination protein NusG [Clostridia bacterium]
MESAWYVVHTYAGYENKVKANLEKRIESMDMGDKIFRIIVPTEDQIEIKSGEKKINKKRIFPSYVIVEMILTDESWYLVRNTSGVTGFVGTGGKPVPLMEHEVQKILKKMGESTFKGKIDYEIGQSVRVTDGPFENFVGSVEEIDLEKGKLKVTISMFGRETPIELDHNQVEEM